VNGCGFRHIGDLNASRVVSFLAERRQGGLSIRTSNGYLTAIKGFTRWLVRDRRAAENPLVHLSALNAKTDVRRERRALSAGEFAALIEASRRGEPFRGLSGDNRALLYIMAANTGLRASELASLTTASFDLDGDPPTVMVEAGYSKHRRRDVLPLRADLVGLLCPVLSRLPDKALGLRQNRRGAVLDSTVEASDRNAAVAKLWPGTWAERSAKMLRIDLEAAGIPYIDADGRVADFHALRHGFISNLARGGVHPKEAQALARHSSITLTLDRYTHVGITDLTAALDRLPELPGGNESERQALRATGTDSAPPNLVAHHVAHDVAETPVPACSVVSRIVSASDERESQETSENAERIIELPGKKSQ
jgi:site-specific recombinase XerD